MTTRLPLPPSWPPMTKTVYKPWLDEQDADNVFFGSVSLQDKDLFYPASGLQGMTSNRRWTAGGQQQRHGTKAPFFVEPSMLSRR